MLRLMIEQHGAKVQSSSRAERQRWSVDVAQGVTTVATLGCRRLYPMQRWLDVRPLAEDVVRVRQDHADDGRLTWNLDGSVRVEIVRILPDESAIQQTLAARRKCFRTVVAVLLSPHDWRMMCANVYPLPTDSR
jgi:hypothetical protein